MMSLNSDFIFYNCPLGVNKSLWTWAFCIFESSYLAHRVEWDIYVKGFINNESHTC